VGIKAVRIGLPNYIGHPFPHLIVESCTMSDMEVDHPAPKGKDKKEAKPRFEVKKVGSADFR